MIGCPAWPRVFVMFIQKLQYLPKASYKGHVIGNGWIGLKERDQARALILGCTDKVDELPHVRRQFIKAVPRNKGIEHFSAQLAALAEEARIVRFADPRSYILHRR